MHRTRAALPVITTLLRSSESDGLTQAIKQRRSRVNAKPVLLSIDVQGDLRVADAIIYSRRIGGRALCREVAPIESGDNSGRPCSCQKGPAAETTHIGVMLSRFRGFLFRHRRLRRLSIGCLGSKANAM